MIDGFFRSLQGSITMFVGVIVVLTIGYLFARWFIKTNAPSLTEARNARMWINRITTIAVVIAVVGLGWRMVSLASINRIPRADTDRSGVYDQMQNNLKP